MNHAVTYIRGVNNKDLESALRLAASDLGWTVTVGKYKGMVMYDLSGSRILPQMRVGVGNNLLHTFAGLPFWIARKKKVLEYQQRFSEHLMDLEKNVGNLQWDSYRTMLLMLSNA